MSHHRDQPTQPGHLVSVVIPCYNEQQRLDTEAIAKFLSTRSSTRIVLVDDASTDNTLTILAALASKLPNQVTVLRLETNQGKAEAVRHGIRHSLRVQPQFVAYWDADLSTPLQDLDRLVTSALQAPDAIMFSASRTLMTRRETLQTLTRFIVSRLFARLAKALGTGLSDPQNGAKLLRNGPWLDQATSYPFRTRWFIDLELINRARAHSPLEIDAERLFTEIPASSWQHKTGSHLRYLEVLIDIARRASDPLAGVRSQDPFGFMIWSSLLLKGIHCQGSG